MDRTPGTNDRHAPAEKHERGDNCFTVVVEAINVRRESKSPVSEPCATPHERMVGMPRPSNMQVDDNTQTAFS